MTTTTEARSANTAELRNIPHDHKRSGARMTSVTPKGTTNGIRDPEKPDQWLVPPLPAGSTLYVVVQHFLRCGRENPTDRQRNAYYEGYLDILRTAGEQIDERSVDPLSWRWYQSLCHAVSRCVETSAGSKPD
ncbi:MAG TPA: hypothetical protein VF444_02005 [Pseudonocardiaceae bacterium]